MLPLDFDLEKYKCHLYEWYNPPFVVLQFNELRKRYPNKMNHFLFKKALEALQGAVAILGARSLHESNTYVMQMNRQCQRPDVIASKRTTPPEGPTVNVMPIEITEMEDHTFHGDIGKFLLEKKLNKDYPKETIFVCIVNKQMQYDIKEVAKKIRVSNKTNPIYIIGKILGVEQDLFSIASPQPIIAKTTFSLSHQSKNYPYHSRVTFEEDKMNRKDSGWVQIPVKPINLFDFFMLNESRIKKVFGEGNTL